MSVTSPPRAPRTELPPRRAGLLLRAGLVVGAGAATGLQAPTAVRSALAAAALLAVGDLLVRGHRRGGRESVAVAVGSALAAVVAAGVGLNLVPAGLDAAGWAVGLTLLGLLVVGAEGRRQRTGSAPRRLPALGDVLRTDGLWYAGAAVLVLAGLVVAVSVTRHAERPPVQLSTTRGPDGDVVVVVSSPVSAGPYDLWLEDVRSERLLRTAVPVVAGRPLRVPLQRFGNRLMRVALRETGSQTDLLYVIVNPDR